MILSLLSLGRKLSLCRLESDDIGFLLELEPSDLIVKHFFYLVSISSASV